MSSSSMLTRFERWNVDKRRTTKFAYSGALVVYKPTANPTLCVPWENDAAARASSREQCASIILVMPFAFRGHAGLVGGAPEDEDGENPFECCKREIKEELGWTLDSFTDEDNYAFTRIDFRGPTPRYSHFYLYVTKNLTTYQELRNIRIPERSQLLELMGVFAPVIFYFPLSNNPDDTKYHNDSLIGWLSQHGTLRDSYHKKHWELLLLLSRSGVINLTQMRDIISRVEMNEGRSCRDGTNLLPAADQWVAWVETIGMYNPPSNTSSLNGGSSSTAVSNATGISVSSTPAVN